MKFYLGGTRKGYWRESLVPFLKADHEYIWPQKKYDLEGLKSFDVYVFWFTPKEKDYFQIAEVFYALFWNHPRLFFGFSNFPNEGVFEPHEIDALEKVGAMVSDLGGAWVPDLQTLGDVINKDMMPSLGAVEVEA